MNEPQPRRVPPPRPMCVAPASMHYELVACARKPSTSQKYTCSRVKDKHFRKFLKFLMHF